MDGAKSLGHTVGRKRKRAQAACETEQEPLTAHSPSTRLVPSANYLPPPSPPPCRRPQSAVQDLGRVEQRGTYPDF